MNYTTADIITDVTSEHFPTATSGDGRFSWHSLSPGYVREIETDITVYVQYGTYTSADGDLISADPTLLRDMRSFLTAVHQLRDERRAAREQRESDAEAAEEARIHGADRIWVAGAEDGWMEWTRDLQPTGRRILPPGPITAYDPALVTIVGGAIGVYSIRRP